MFDDDLRAGLDAVAEGAPSSGDLAAVRSAGLRKARRRSAAMAATALLLVVSAGFAVRALVADSPTQLSTNIADEGSEQLEPRLETDTAPSPSEPESGSSSAAGEGDEPVSASLPTTESTIPPNTSATTTEPRDGGGPLTCESDSVGVIIWTDIGEERYGVYRSTDGGDTYTWLARTLGATTYTDPEFELSFRYRIGYDNAVDRADCAASSAFACHSDTVGAIRWTVGDDGPYVVERSTDGGATFTDLETVGGAGLTDPASGPEARYRVGHGGLAEPVSCSISIEFVCQVMAPGQIRWTDAGRDRYRVYRSDGGAFTFLTSVDASMTFVDADHETAYRYRVDYEGLSPWVDCRDL